MCTQVQIVNCNKIKNKKYHQALKHTFHQILLCLTIATHKLLTNPPRIHLSCNFEISSAFVTIHLLAFDAWFNNTRIFLTATITVFDFSATTKCFFATMARPWHFATITIVNALRTSRSFTHIAFNHLVGAT